MDVRRNSQAGRPIDVSRVQELQRNYQLTALVLQGGGALGAYQAGVYQELDAAGIRPGWVAGISIGALNAAIIAGNPPERRVERLHEFWLSICRQPLLPALPELPASGPGAWSTAMLSAMSNMAAWRAIAEGQAGFFSPRLPWQWFPPHADPATASYYDTAPLRETLERLADFDRINDAREMRVTVGAVNVRNGNFAYFDNAKQKLRPEHFMASGALPPGFPAIEIDGEFYWDGGVVSNTPLYRVLTEQPQRNALIIQVDLWSALGRLPRDLPEVAERVKDIQYSSRTRMITEYMRNSQEQRQLLHDLMALVPKAARDSEAYRRAEQRADSARINVLHLIYHDKAYEGQYKDIEFSLATMRTHWQSGQSDMRHTLGHPQWLALPSAERPFVTHDVHRDAQESV